MIRSNIIMILAYFFIWQSTVFSQSSFTVTPKILEVKSSIDSISKFDISITNNTGIDMLIPLHTVLVDKKVAGEYELAIEFRRVGQKKREKCTPNLDYILDVNIPIEVIKPGETKITHTSIIGSCFREKGEYKVTFYLKKSSLKSKKIKFYSSNTIVIKII